MDSLSAIVLAAALIIIMLGMGLSLTVSDFTQIFIKPKAILIGLASQLILLPVVGFLLINIYNLPDEIAIGVIILAACPGGATSNLITHLSKGDTALSVSLTAISSLVTIASIPFIINLGLKNVLGTGTTIQLDVLNTILQIFIIVIIPVTIGMFIRVKNLKFADRMLNPVRKASAVVFILVLLGVVIKERANLIPYFQQAGVVTLALNLATMGIGLALGQLFRLPFTQRISIAIEGGIQNGTLAITIATILLANSTFAIAPAVYSLNMFLTAGVFIIWANRKIKTIKK